MDGHSRRMAAGLAPLSLIIPAESLPGGSLVTWQRGVDTIHLSHAFLRGIELGFGDRSPGRRSVGAKRFIHWTRCARNRCGDTFNAFGLFVSPGMAVVVWCSEGR